MADLIAELRRDMRRRLLEIDRELAGVKGLIDERARIEAALAQPPFADGQRMSRAASKGTSPRKTRTRAPRGANREAILSVVRERPGATAREIADITTMSRAVVYGTAAKLVEHGLLAKEPRPGGQTGFRLQERQSGVEASSPEASKGG